ncbi:host attachment protein [bacterium]|nr:host attachment protein [bacterium]MBU1995405.1 host attachment protein [bacterium]
MLSKLIIVADLQRFKLYTSKQDPLGREALNLLESVESLEVHQKMSEKVSDRKGNFQSAGGSGSGEDHNLVLEDERRRIKEIAKQISEALQNHNHKSWYFAAPKAINNKIVEQLDAVAKESMKINLHSDLTKIPDNKLLEHFNK